MKGSLFIAKPFGIRVFVHWTFSLLILWVLGSMLAAGAGLSQAAEATLFVLAVFGCVILHEFLASTLERKLLLRLKPRQQGR